MARSDAQRNREKILAAARTSFAEAGELISMAELSRRAGVGMATLYRNFPGRRDVLEALFADEVDALLAAAEDTTLLPWLRRFFIFLQSKHPIGAELLDLSNDDATVLEHGRGRVTAAAAPLVTAAQRSGTVRDDLTVEQILAMVKAIARVPGHPEYVEPILDATLDGLRPRPGDEPARVGSRA
jgi:AcrR family transcriptional regulator